ncbi:hypothetical protein [Tumebacillus lipolyticus]|uniref:Uncharacterized protein n=1 Tax=Tumebacillus lipolyticus TaxID=1280370 RepID=A0ABW4ZSB6_9BACL
MKKLAIGVVVTCAALLSSTPSFSANVPDTTQQAIIQPELKKLVTGWKDYYTEGYYEDKYWYEEDGYCGYIPYVSSEQREAYFGIYWVAFYKGYVNPCDY